MTISFPKFYSDAKFGHIYDVTIAVTWNGKKTKQNKTINSKFINLRPYRVSSHSMLSISVYALRLSVLRGMGGNALANDHRVSVGLMNNDK